MTDVNQPILPASGEEWPEGDLPEQMGGPRSTLPPGMSTFRLPLNLSQLWHDVAIEDTRPYLANGQVNPTGPLGPHATVGPEGKKSGAKVTRKQLKLDRNSPLIVEGGKQDGEPMTATFTTNPRVRGKKDDPKSAWVSDIAYLLDICLQDKSRPKTPDDVVATVNKYAGKPIRLEHGLTGQCRFDKPRYILVATQSAGGQVEEANVPDQSGKKGCGKRWYTKDFRNPETGQYDTEIACTCGMPTPEEAAAGATPVTVVLRAYESVERFLPPIVEGVGAAPGATQAV